MRRVQRKRCVRAELLVREYVTHDWLGLRGLIASVVLVDADMAVDAAGCRLLPIAPTDAAVWNTHESSPASLLALARELYGAMPRAWCLALSGDDFRLGEGLSPLVRVRARDAVRIIETLLHSL